MISVRRAAAALAAGAVLSTTAAGVAAAAPSPTPSPVTVPAGLYGKGDPTYDGVWRQSLAFLAQRTSGIQPADQPVEWLLAQQCADGGFASFRPDPAGAPCDAKTVMDTNATAAAVQALIAVAPQSADPEKTKQAAQAGAAWLKGAQNADGGWSYNPAAPGGPATPSDANSTSLVIGALAAAKVRPSAVKSADGKTPYDALVTFALPCAGKEVKDGGAGAFAYQPDKTGKLVANDDATAAATLAGLGKGLTARGAEPQQTPACVDTNPPTPDGTAANGAAYLTGRLAKTGHLDVPPMPGAENATVLPDYGNTADAVVALAAAGAKKEARGALAWLEKNAGEWAKTNGPGAYAQLVFAAHAMETDPRSFGTLDLIEQLNATGPAPKAPDNSEASTGADDEGGFNVWWIIGIGTVVGVGVGFLLSGRKK
ncbi:secreted protein [Streptomyces laurentii]|uniref:Secreted protein n=1 Tax=Streptomyces laurentii TaxID=39478 RepID=A0A160NYC3_STRLU|nr:secreted protein [Streptomyces laurentii]